MNNADIKEFVRDRNEALMAAVVNDDWDAVKRYCKKYGVKLPKEEDVIKAGIYKAVQEVISIPQEVKDQARTKCVALGFKPTMWEG